MNDRFKGISDKWRIYRLQNWLMNQDENIQLLNYETLDEQLRIRLELW